MSGRFQPGYLFPGTVYRVIRHLATGGMGSLYEVEDETVGRVYVLKTLHPELVEREDLAIRMREEARALGRLQHPNIVQVITAGVTADPQKMPFYVMERLVGQNLRTVIEVRKKDGGIGLAQALRITIDLAAALQHAHERQLVHRDVKPENIFLHRGAKGTEIKLVDFGIVRMLNREATLTRGKFIGTLKYSSPEQITGLREIGPASDLYCLALVLYEMLRLRGPFDDAPDHLKIGFAHANETPSPLSAHVTAIPPEVDALVMQALAKAPEARPSSCAAFADGLRSALRRLEQTPHHRTDVELLSAHHSVDLRDAAPDHATETSAGLPPTMPEGAAAAPATVPEDAAVSATVAAPPPTPPMGPPPTPLLVSPGAVAHGGGVTAVLGPPGAFAVPAPQALASPQPSAFTPQAPPMHAGVAGPRVIDRDAPTRVPAASVAAPRVPSNDTMVEPPSRVPTAPLSPGALVGSGAAGPLPPPPVSKPQAYISTVHTRPRRDRGPVMVVGIAAAVAVMMIAGALVIVRHPRGGNGGPHGSPATVVPAK